MTTHDVLLPGMGTIRCLRPEQATEIHRQVLQYFKHGIVVTPGNTVFDIGANIGLFSLLVHSMCHGDVDIYMFEPIPSIFEALQINAGRADASRLRAYCCGLSSQPGTAEFAFCPNMPTLSTAYGKEHGELQEQVKASILRNLRDTHLRGSMDSMAAPILPLANPRQGLGTNVRDGAGSMSLEDGL